MTGLKTHDGELLNGHLEDGTPLLGFGIDSDLAGDLFNIAAIPPAEFVAGVRRRSLNDLREAFVDLHSNLRKGGFAHSTADSRTKVEQFGIAAEYKKLPHGKERLDFLNKNKAALEAVYGTGVFGKRKREKPKFSDAELREVAAAYNSAAHGKPRLKLLKEQRPALDAANERGLLRKRT